jgi:GNAT superfamily N-acetyltransferase
MNLQIRAATPADVPVILELIRALAAYERLTGEVSATEEALHGSLFPKSGPAEAECVLGVADGRVAGYAAFFTSYSTFLARPGLYLEDLFVLPELRKRGIGRALLVHLAALANERGCGRMEWTVLDWNTPAIEFYASLGARTLPDWRTCRLAGEALSRYARAPGP